MREEKKSTVIMQRIIKSRQTTTTEQDECDVCNEWNEKTVLIHGRILGIFQ